MPWTIDFLDVFFVLSAGSNLKFSEVNNSDYFIVQPYYNTDATSAWKKFRFVLSKRLDFCMVDNLSIAVHVNIAFSRCDIAT